MDWMLSPLLSLYLCSLEAPMAGSIPVEEAPPVEWCGGLCRFDPDLPDAPPHAHLRLKTNHVFETPFFSRKALCDSADHAYEAAELMDEGDVAAVRYWASTSPLDEEDESDPAVVQLFSFELMAYLVDNPSSSN
jgi:hypothetical protein